MNLQDSSRLEQLYNAMVELPIDRRGSFVAMACEQDPRLRMLLESVVKERVNDEIVSLPARNFLSEYLEDDVLTKTANDRALPVATRSAEELLTQSAFAGYRIIRHIGSGGMGDVYEAEQAKPRRLVALKLLGSHNRVQGQLDIESEVLGRLDHPGIARIYAAGTAETARGSEPFFAMEYVQGTDLLNYVEHTSASVRMRIQIVAKLLEAVSYAHQRGLVHRDLKPDNILILPTGEPKILDFGVALFTGNDDHLLSTATQRRGLAGTVRYMSPEQTLGDWRNIDGRSDVYALGVVLYELLTERRPYAEGVRERGAILHAVRRSEPAKISEISEPVRSDLQAVIDKSLRKERDERYQTAEEFAHDLNNLLSRQPLSVDPRTRLRQLDRWSTQGERIKQAGLVTQTVGYALAVLHGIYFALGVVMAFGLAPALASGIDLGAFLVQTAAWTLLMSGVAVVGSVVRRHNLHAIYVSLALSSCLSIFTILVLVDIVPYVMAGALQDEGSILYSLFLVIAVLCFVLNAVALRAHSIERILNQPPQRLREAR